MLGGERGASKGLVSIHGRSSGFVRALGRAFAPRDHRDGAAQRARQEREDPGRPAPSGVRRFDLLPASRPCGQPSVSGSELVSALLGAAAATATAAHRRGRSRRRTTSVVAHALRGLRAAGAGVDGLATAVAVAAAAAAAEHRAARQGQSQAADRRHEKHVTHSNPPPGCPHPEGSGLPEPCVSLGT